MSYAEKRLGSERIKGAYAWRSFIEAGYIYTNSNHLNESLSNAKLTSDIFVI
jgi:hypothetical protein